MTKTSSTKIDKVTDFSPANCTIAELKRFREDPKYAENIEELVEAIRRRESHQKKLSSKTDKQPSKEKEKEHGEVHVHVQIVEVNERTNDETSRRAATPEETDAFIGQLDNWMGSSDRFGDFLSGVADDMKVKAMKGNYATVDFEFTSAAHAAEYTKGKPHLQMEVFDKEGDPGRDPTMEELETAVRAINDVVAEDFAEGLGVFSAYVYAEPASASASASDATAGLSNLYVSITQTGKGKPWIQQKLVDAAKELLTSQGYKVGGWESEEYGEDKGKGFAVGQLEMDDYWWTELNRKGYFEIKGQGVMIEAEMP